MKKERLFYLDFIRAISVISIVIFHFNISMRINVIKGHDILFTNYANGDLGSIGVALFFIISGAALMYTYDERFSIKNYFNRRFISLYPMFWTAYAIAFLYFFYINRTINHSIPNWTFILTVLGLDGYLYSITPNFYILGEWFLGCIILLYFCFPILRKLIIKKPKILLCCVCIFYIILVQNYNFAIQIDHNFIIRILDFTIGMYFMRYIKTVKVYQFALALIISIVMMFVPINIKQMYKITIFGIAIFFVLVYISQYFKFSNIKYICEVLNKYSYTIFLVHHVIIEQVVTRFNALTITRNEAFCLFLITCIIISVVSVYVYKISNIISKHLSKTKLNSYQKQN